MSQKPIKKERKRASKRSHLVVPLIVISMLICIIATIILGSGIGRTQENTEIGKDVEPNKEEILAETVQAGETYTVPEDGVYKIELHGGHGQARVDGSEGGNGSKVTGYVRLRKDDILTTERHEGGYGSRVYGGKRWWWFSLI